MKPTDEERREVARKLRGIEAAQFDEGELVDCGEVEAELGLVSDDGAWYRLEDVQRLADLIEPEQPRTCGTCGSFRRCCGCGAGWCMELMQPVRDDDAACEEHDPETDGRARG